MNDTWAVATGHPIATAAAKRVLTEGGNATDAGVAAGIAIGVVQPDLVSFAGVAPIILYRSDQKRVVSLDGVGVWPRAANVETMQRDHGDHVPQGLLRTVVPAAPASWIRALRDHGTMSFGAVAADAYLAARDGFEVYPLFASFVTERLEKYARYPSTAEIFLPGGKPPEVGDVFVQRDLAATLKTMIDAEAGALAEGADRASGLAAARAAFYTGPIAERIVAHHIANNGLLRAEDLADYEVREEPTYAVRFRGADIHCCGAWCQGISMAQTLAMLEHAGPDAVRDNGKIDQHFLLEVLKRVFADREAHVTDPRFMAIPPEDLLARDFIAARLAGIGDRSDPLPAPGVPGASASDENSGQDPVYRTGCADTSHVSVIDSYGNMFSATPSDTSSDTEVIPGTGLWISSRGSQSRAIPGHLNALAPGKRPRLTPNPILGLKGGEPWLAMGTPGGDVQVQALAQVLVNMLDLGMSPEDAVAAPRVATYAYPGSFSPHDVHPNKVLYEADMPEPQVIALIDKGHDVEAWPARTWKAGGVCIALREGNRLTAVADPRRVGTAETGRTE